MQLIKKMFGRTPGERPGPGSESAQFQESDHNSGSVSRNGPRRELVHVVLRDSLRRHGIPSAWIDCRILSVVTRSQRSGVHLQFIVRDGVDRLLAYVPAFQTSFLKEIAGQHLSFANELGNLLVGESDRQRNRPCRKTLPQTIVGPEDAPSQGTV